jgi:molecular chaperone DnaJ
MAGAALSIDVAYAELGLAPGASESEVRAAWRRLASRWHPDRNASKDAVDIMQRINSAYERIRQAAFSSGGLQESAQPKDSSAPPPSAATRGPIVRRKLRLSLEEAALGCTKVLRGKLTEACAVCAGSGTLKATSSCKTCKGSGSVRTTNLFGWIATRSNCTDCEGRGFVHRVCRACEGHGKHSTAYRRSVRIPGGVRQGDVLSAARACEGEGDFDGTLELHVEVAPHKFFVTGDDGELRCEMPVDGLAWMANAWVDVPTLGGLHRMRLQRGRHVYRLRGQGLLLQRSGTARGDYLVTVEPVFPEELSAEQQALLDQLVQSSIAAQERAAGPLRDWRRTVEAWKRSSSR